MSDHTPPDERRNIVLALILSLIVVVGWQAFVMPRVAPAPRPVPNQMTNQPTSQTASQAQLQSPTGVAPQPVRIPDAPRIIIDTPALRGSINAYGSRFDDLRTVRHTAAQSDHTRMSADGTAPLMPLFSKADQAAPYFAAFGYLSAEGTALPGADTPWTIVGTPKLTPTTPVILTYESPQLSVQRTISVDDNYLFTISDRIRNKTKTPLSLHPYGLMQRDAAAALNPADPVEAETVRRGAVAFSAGGIKEVTFRNLSKQIDTPMPLQDGWAGFNDKYRLAVAAPAAGEPVEGRYRYVNDPVRPIFQFDYTGAARVLSPDAPINVTHRLFVGAKETDALRHYESAAGMTRLDYAVDWGMLWFVTRPMFDLLMFIRAHTTNAGIAVLILTLIVKTVFFPLVRRSFIASEKMRIMQPQIKALREKHADNPTAMQQAFMELYRKQDLHPMAPIWPILVQLPVFIALYNVLSTAIELRHAPFFGHIRDLSAADPSTIFNLFGLLDFQSPIPFALGLWPVLMGLTMHLQQKMTPTPGIDPTQASIMRWMPVIVVFFTAHFAAGLVIYWTWSNVLSIGQTLVLRRTLGNKDA